MPLSFETNGVPWDVTVFSRLAVRKIVADAIRGSKAVSLALKTSQEPLACDRD